MKYLTVFVCAVALTFSFGCGGKKGDDGKATAGQAKKKAPTSQPAKGATSQPAKAAMSAACKTATAAMEAMKKTGKASPENVKAAEVAVKAACK